ncbi:NAD(P)-dependent oxidoreductase [Paenibacillus sp.]|uniref:NAD(P)-dependent oxidoreductase n=1 Tax=Paenibacillus sp. TaxID=58172 RepID=UPI003463EB0C
MKIAVYGATGTIGQRIVNEALTRGHEVTAIVRDASRVAQSHDNLTVATGDILDSASVAERTAGHDVVVSAFGPKMGEESTLVEATQALIAGVKQAGVGRLISVGGAGSLEVAPGVQVVDTPDFPDAWKPIALAHRDALDVYRHESTLAWTNVSPAALIEPGERTGQYRTGTDQLVVNAEGNSRISAEDFSVAILDEVENPQFSGRRFTAAY